MIGYNTQVTLLPDMDVGVFMTMNGFDYVSLARLLTVAFIMDVVLDEEHWLNTTTVCTFPEPWAPRPELPDLVQMMSHRDDGPGHQFINQKIPRSQKGQNEKSLPDDLTPYVGEYGDFFYGNISVYSDDSKLFMHYGLFEPWELAPTEVEHEFVGIPAPSDWPLAPKQVSFDYSEEGLQQFDLCLASFDSSDALFVRGRKMSEAPDPPNPNDCS